MMVRSRHRSRQMVESAESMLDSFPSVTSCSSLTVESPLQRKETNKGVQELLSVSLFRRICAWSRLRSRSQIKKQSGRWLSRNLPLKKSQHRNPRSRILQMKSRLVSKKSRLRLAFLLFSFSSFLSQPTG